MQIYTDITTQIYLKSTSNFQEDCPTYRWAQRQMLIPFDSDTNEKSNFEMMPTAQQDFWTNFQHDFKLIIKFTHEGMSGESQDHANTKIRSSKASTLDSETLIVKIITKPLDNHVALATSHWLIIYTNDQSQIGFLNSDTTGTLKRHHLRKSERKHFRSSLALTPAWMVS